MEIEKTFEQIIFDLLLGVSKFTVIEFADINQRIKFYLELQKEGYDKQFSVSVASPDILELYTEEYVFSFEDDRYLQADTNKFIKKEYHR